MASPFARKLYNWGPIQYVLVMTGLNHHVRRCYVRFDEARRGTTELTAGDVSVEVTERTIPDEGYLEPERTVLVDLLDEIRPTDVFWDVGADKGLYTCPAGKALAEGSVVAFEPHPVRRGELTRNLRRNGISVTVRTEALSDHGEKTEFGYRIEPSGEGGEFTAELAKGDDVASRDAVQRPTIVKIDVEGAELDVLRGLDETLRREDCRVVYVELHNRIADFGGSWSELRAYLRERGFAIETIAKRVGEDLEQPYLKATKSE